MAKIIEIMAHMARKTHLEDTFERFPVPIVVRESKRLPSEIRGIEDVPKEPMVVLEVSSMGTILGLHWWDTEGYDYKRYQGAMEIRFDNAETPEKIKRLLLEGAPTGGVEHV